MVVTNTTHKINLEKTSLKPYVARVWECITSIFANNIEDIVKEKSSPLEILKESFFYLTISVNPKRLTNTKTMLLKLRESMTLCFCSYTKTTKEEGLMRLFQSKGGIK